MSLSIDPNKPGAPTEAPTTVTPPADAGTAPKVGTPEYESWVETKARERLASKNQPAKTTAPEAPEGESLILGKFKSQDDLARAYESLQAEYTRIKQGKPAETTPPAEGSTETTDKTLEGQAAKVDRAKYTQELLQSGTLSEASYAELESLGFDKTFVDTYIEGQRARITQQEAELKAVVGGDGEFTKLSSWAAANLSDSDLEMYNAQVSAGSTSAKMALTWLKAQYEAAYGTAPKSRIQGDTTDTSKSGFKSREESIQAMRDPRYQRDPAYRAWHDQMLANRSY